jgi:AcrR family transcriptional regulator
MPEKQARERLLDAAVAYAVAHGISDLTLRELAAAIGTSHRMLIYHFGSKEALLVAVTRAVEAAQRDLLTELSVDDGLSPAEATRHLWAGLAAPELWPQERLFFELYARALQHRPGTSGFLDGIVGDWVETTAAYLVAQGVAPDVARSEARLGLAVFRGLLLDLLATGDRAAVDAALERYLVHARILTGRAATEA